MKKILFLLTITLLTATIGFSQAPGILNYQGVARNSVGNVLANKNISLRLTIRNLTAGGAVVYQEVRGVTTNPFGLFNVQLGSPGASGVVGTVAGVNWAVGDKYIQVEIDPNGGSSFINIGTAQLASVPYSLYSTLSGDLVLPFNKTQADAGTLFKITNSGTGSGSTALEGLTNSTAGSANAIIGTVTSAAPGSFSSGVRGINNGTGGLGIGVYGSQAGSGWGVYGTTPSGIGVYGLSTSGTGVQGSSNTGVAGIFINTNASNASDALQASTNGTATSWALRATSTGAQGAGIFQYNNAGGSANALRVMNNGSGASVSALTTGTGNAGNFSNTNAANPLPTVAISTTSNNAPALSVTGPDIWGSAIGINNSVSGMEWRMNVQGTTWQVTKIPGSTFTPFRLQQNGIVDFPSTAGAQRVTIQDNGDVGIGIAVPFSKLTVVQNNSGVNLGGGAVTGSEIKFLNSGTSHMSIYNSGNNALTFAQTSALSQTNVPGTPLMTLTSGGRLGIGTTTPTRNLHVVGNMNLTDGTQGLNKILTSDAAGNASWQTLGGGVGIGGAGTLNYVSKWTPDGMNLGNSMIYDNASTTTIGGVGVLTANNTTTFRRTTASPNDASLGFVTASDGAGIFLEGATGDLHITQNNNSAASGTPIMTFEDVNLNVGIGTTTPGANTKLQVDHGMFGSTGSTILASSDITTNGNLTGVLGNGGWYGLQGHNFNTQVRGVSVGVRGWGAGTGQGNGFGVIGLADGASATNNYGLHGTASGATGLNIGVYATGTQFAAVLDGIAQVGTSTSNFSTVNLGPTATVTSPSMAFETAGGEFFNIHENANGQLAFRANNLAPGASDVIVTMDDDNLNVGINTVAPAANSKLHVDGSGTSGGFPYGILATSRTGTTSFNTHGVWADGSWRGVYGTNLSSVSRFRSIGVQGVAGGTNYSVEAIGVYANANGTGTAGVNNYGLYATASGAAGSNYSAWLDGQVRITDGTQAAGYVLTSDAAGNASWQNVVPNVGIGLQLLSANVVIGGSFVVITNWNTITHETGGANYNPIAGEYTITVSGTYQINASLAWSPTGPDAIDMILDKNGSPINEITQFVQPTGFVYGMNLNCLLHLNAGDVLRIRAGHSAGAGSPATLIASFLSNNFSAQLVKRD